MRSGGLIAIDIGACCDVCRADLLRLFASSTDIICATWHSEETVPSLRVADGCATPPGLSDVESSAGAPIIGVLRRGSDASLLPYADPRLVDVVMLPEDGRRLRNSVAAFVIESATVVLEEALSDRLTDPILSAAVRSMLRQPYPSRWRADPLPRRPTVSGVAATLGVSREHLSRLSSAAGLRLASCGNGWWSFRASVMRSIERLSWDEAAWRCGYSSVQGLSELFNSTLGLRLRAANRVGAGTVFEWLREEMVG